MTTRRSTPRFRRETKDGEVIPAPPLQLTPDDLQILLHVYRNRLIDSESLFRLFPNRSPDVMRRRLKKMFLAHYLGRPPRQVELYTPGGGSEYMAYGLDREGARILRDKFGKDMPLYHWLQKNSEIKKTNINHTLGVARFMINLEVSARKRGNVRVIYFDELLATYAPERTRKRRDPDRWRTHISWNGHTGQEGTRPDQIFSLEYLDRPKDRNRMYFFFEQDEGSETIEPGERVRRSKHFFRSSSFLRKLVIYASSHKERMHETHFGLPGPARVLTITTTAERAANLIKLYDVYLRPQPLAVRPGLFLFTDKDQLAMFTDDLLAMPWANCIEDSVYLDGR